MKSRMKNPVFVLPETLAPLRAVHAAVVPAVLSEKLAGLVHLRVSQVNGCSICVDMHARNPFRNDESLERLLAVSAWRDTPYFDAAERAALALAESVTRIADRPEGVPDDVWAEAARHFDERQLSGLLLVIANANVWNRLNVATRQMVGEVKWKE